MDAFQPTTDRQRNLTNPPKASHTSWWTVADGGTDFAQAARDAAARMANENQKKIPDRSHIHDLRVGK